MFDPVGKSIALVVHTYYVTSGTPDGELIRYLSGKTSTILYIVHPFGDATAIPLNTTVTEYDGGGIARKKTAPSVRLPAPLLYIKEVLFTLWYVATSGRVYDLYIGADNLNAFAGLVLRLFGRVRKVAYYVIDFTPVRFENRLVNALYQAINKVCCYHADVIWNVSETMVGGREKIGIRESFSAPQVTVPLGCAFGDIHEQRHAAKDVRAADLVYFGSLKEEHGPGLAVEALPEILEQLPDARIVFAGDGPLRESLETRARALGVAEHVEFTGFLESGEDVYRLLCASGLALATYPADTGSYKTYSDPGKVKIYLACGLPVLITDVPPIARTVRDRGAGEIVADDPKSLAETVIAIASDREHFVTMRECAVELGREYDWKAIWKRTFEAMKP